MSFMMDLNLIVIVNGDGKIPTEMFLSILPNAAYKEAGYSSDLKNTIS